MRETTKGILIGVGLALVLAVAAFLGWRQAGRVGVVLTDGVGIRVPASTATAREVLWEPAALLPEWINAGGENYEPRVSRDGRTLIFVRGKAGGGADLWAAEAGTGPTGEMVWGEAFPLDGVNTAAVDELGGALSADGKTLYFYSDRSGGLGGYDLWMCRRLGEGASDREASGGSMGGLRAARWSEAENLGPSVNGPFNEYGPAVSADGAMLFFASNRPGPGEAAPDVGRAWPATVREDQTRRTYDLYAAPITERGLGEARRLDALSTTANEGTPAISPRGDFLYFASDRAGGAGGLDLYRARLGTGGAIGPVENLGWPINTPANEVDPTVSMEGFALHFSSDRDPAQEADGRGGGAEPGDGVLGMAGERRMEARYAIHSTVSREVYHEREAMLARMDWWGLWNAAWPWLLLLALLGALLALLRRFLRDEDWQRRWRRLSLLAKCFVLSLLLHALLGALFTVWYVSQSVGEMLARPGGTRVALVSRGVGADLASQIRGGLTDVAIRSERVEAKAPMAIELSDLMVPASSVEAQRVEAIERAMDAMSEGAESSPNISAPTASRAPIDPVTSAEVATPTARSGERASEVTARVRAESVTPVSNEARLAALSAGGSRTLDVVRVTASEASMGAGVGTEVADARVMDRAGPAVASQLAPATRSEPAMRAPEARIGASRDEGDLRIALETTPNGGASPAIPAVSVAGGPGGRVPAGLNPARVVVDDVRLVDTTGNAAEGPAVSMATPPIPTPVGEIELPRAGQVRTPGTGEAMRTERDEASLVVEVVASGASVPRTGLDVGSARAPVGGARVEPESNTVREASIALDGAERAVGSGAPVAAGLSPGGSMIAVPTAGGPSVAIPSAASASGGDSGSEVTTAHGGRMVIDASRAEAPVRLGAMGGAPRVDAAPPSTGTPVGDERSLAGNVVRAQESESGRSRTDVVAPRIGAMPVTVAPMGVPGALALPAFSEEPAAPVEPLGVLAGVVTDAATGRAIAGARVRLDFTDAPAVVARTNTRGEYRLSVPAGIPDHVAISAVAPGYTPASINVRAAELARATERGGALRRDFALTELDWAVVPIEADPEVRHLGNDEYEGAINSQFQRSTEGLVYTREFTLAADQIGRNIRAAELVLLAKGAQANNPVIINGRPLDQFIVGTPRDGSFGELVFQINPRWLVEGVNTIEIRSVRGSNDLDDFEFVNPRLRLRPTGVVEPRR